MNIALLTYNVEFQGRRRKPENIDPPAIYTELQKYVPQDIGLSQKAERLFVALNAQINDDWAEIKKYHDVFSSPKYVFSGDKSAIVTIKPIYGGLKPQVLFEIDNDKYSERFIFDRSNPQKFRYDKSVITDHGSATLKSFNSEVQKNSELTQIADALVLKYVPEILSLENKKKYFGIVSGAKKNVVKVIL